MPLEVYAKIHEHPCAVSVLPGHERLDSETE